VCAGDPRLLHLHEQQDVERRDALDHPVGKGESAGDGSLRPPSRLARQVRARPHHRATLPLAATATRPPRCRNDDSTWGNMENPMRMIVSAPTWPLVLGTTVPAWAAGREAVVLAQAAPAASEPAPAAAASPAAPAAAPAPQKLVGLAAWSQVVGNSITGKE